MAKSSEFCVQVAHLAVKFGMYGLELYEEFLFMNFNDSDGNLVL
jgi:hypothetical protein